jgi:hypothetical protein
MLPKKGKKLPHGGGRDGSDADFAKVVAAALRTELGSTHQAIKTVMHWTGASERTVKHWFAGTHAPSGEHFVAVARHSDEVLKMFLIRANRNSTIVATKLVDLRGRLLEIVKYIDQQS